VKDGELGAYGLPTRSRGTDEDVLVRCIEGGEDLGLDGVEGLKLAFVELFKLWVPQCVDG